MSAHWDHITVGKVALRIAKKLKIPLAAFTVSPEFKKQRTAEVFLARRKFGKYAGIPDHRDYDFRIKINLTKKRKAMSSHVSQFGLKGPWGTFSKSVAQKTFGYEYFVEEKL